MRVMWFTNIPMPAMDQHLGIQTLGSGWWMSSLLDQLKGRADLSMAVTTVYNVPHDCEFSHEGVDYFAYRPSIGSSAMQCDLKRCAELVDRWKPDIIHVHGTERWFGLLGARKFVSPPTVVTIQGLLHVYRPKHFGSLGLMDILRCTGLGELLRPKCAIWAPLKQYRTGVPVELEILRGNHFFTGQTEWDRANIWSQNPQARYFRVGRVLRLPFYQASWSVNNCRRHTIIFTNAGKPLRDVDTLLKAIEILQPTFPDIKLRLGGHVGGRWGYQRFIARKLKRMGKTVELLGYLSAEQMQQSLLESHVFAICSQIENESISLSEAMLLGLPCVCSYAGGMPTTLKDDNNGLFFPPGDPGLLADCIRRFFENDALASRLGRAAREQGLLRHEPLRVAEQQIDVYKQILAAVSATEV